MGSDEEDSAEPLYDVNNKLTGYRLTIDMERFYKWQFALDQNTGTIEYDFRWEVNTTSSNVSFYDDFTWTLYGQPNECYDTVVTLANDDNIQEVHVK
jgi:hypothetical protein